MTDQINILCGTLTHAQVLAFPAFARWWQKLQQTPGFERVDILGFKMFGPNIGFLLVDAIVKNSSGKVVPGCAFLRGDSVGMLVVLVIVDGEGNPTGEKYTILTKQCRIPVGEMEMEEIPAGMMDRENNFAGVAAKELNEEVFVGEPRIHVDNLIALSKPLALSGGGCDECMTLWAFEKKITRSKLEDYCGKITGNNEEGEHIQLKVCSVEELRSSGDMKTLLAFHLYMEQNTSSSKRTRSQ